MSIQQEIIGELGSILINSVFDYMQEHQDRMIKNNLTFDQQIEIVGIALTGAKISISNALKEGTIQ